MNTDAALSSILLKPVRRAISGDWLKLEGCLLGGSFVMLLRFDDTFIILSIEKRKSRKFYSTKSMSQYICTTFLPSIFFLYLSLSYDCTTEWFDGRNILCVYYYDRFMINNLILPPWPLKKMSFLIAIKYWFCKYLGLSSAAMGLMEAYSYAFLHEIAKIKKIKKW